MRLKIAIAVLTLAAIGGGSIGQRAPVAEAQQHNEALTGDVVVKFKPGTTLAGVGAALSRADATPVESTTTGAVLLEPDAGQSVDDAVAALNADPNVLYAEPDALVTMEETPNDTYYAAYQAWHFNQINAPAAWDAETGAASTVIAVVDTGVQSVHPDLNDNMVAGANFVRVPIAGASNSGGQVRITTSTPHPYLNGEQITISGNSAGGVNGTWTIAMPAALNITSSTVSGGTITVTTSSPHNLSVGEFVMVRDHLINGSNGGANGQWTITAVPSATQFRFSCSPDCPNGSGAGGVAKQASWFNLSGSTYTSAGTGGNALNTSARDDEGHGTSVAGFVAAESNNGNGVAGVCWLCKIMPVKVLGATGSGSGLDVAAGIEWAVDNGADVINLSLSSPSPSTPMLDAVNYAWNSGVIVVAASGNDGDTLDPSVRYPAKYANALAVGATNNAGARASFSNYGPELDVMAPGEGVTSTAATGFGNSGGWYATGSGTSFATPHVAGVVGLMISHGITDKNAIVSALTSTAVDAGAAGFDNLYGYGIVDAAAALGSADTTPPIVAITSPADGATVSGTVTITATASDASGIEKVRFWAGGSYMSYDLAAPHTKSWDTTAGSDGPQTITVQAFDLSGNASGYVSFTVTVASDPDVNPPSVSLQSPLQGAVVSGVISIDAVAADDVAVQKVQFWAGNAYLSYDISAPYAKSWDTTSVADGAYTLRARAYDTSGNNSGLTSITVYVSNNPDITPPSVSISSPAPGGVISGVVTIAAVASDDAGLQKVQFWGGGSYLGYDTTAPYSRAFDTTALPDDLYTLVARAWDTAGNSSGYVSVPVVVSNSGDVTPPSVSVASPADGETVSGIVTITAQASDNAGLQKVQFWAAGSYLGYDITGPYMRTWDTSLLPDGVYTIIVRAFDLAENATSYVSSSVTVDN